MKPALPAEASPSSPIGLETASAGDELSPVAAENGDHASDSEPAEGGLTCAMMLLLIAPAKPASHLSSRIDQSPNTWQSCGT